MRPRPRELEISADPKAEFLTRLAGSLGGGWLERRRFLGELEHHLEDCMADLRQSGVPEEEAVRDAIARLGDVDTIVRAARAARSTRGMSWHSVAPPIAWIAVGAMSIVTLAAVELPQASAAKVTGPGVTPCTHVGVEQPRSWPHEDSWTSQNVTRRSHLPVH